MGENIQETTSRLGLKEDEIARLKGELDEKKEELNRLKDSIGNFEIRKADGQEI